MLGLDSDDPATAQDAYRRMLREYIAPALRKLAESVTSPAALTAGSAAGDPRRAAVTYPSRIRADPRGQRRGFIK